MKEVFPHVLAHRLRGLHRYDAKTPSGEELRHFSRSRTDVGDEMCPVSQGGLCLVQEGVEDGARVGGSDGAVSRCLDLEGVSGFHLGILSGLRKRDAADLARVLASPQVIRRGRIRPSGVEECAAVEACADRLR